MKPTDYVDFDSGDYKGHHITRVGCMKCNDTIGSKSPVTNDLYYWSHKRDYKVQMSDGSFAHVPVCEPCLPTITSADLLLFDLTIKHGWRKEQQHLLDKYPKRGFDSMDKVDELANRITVLRRA